MRKIDLTSLRKRGSGNLDAFVEQEASLCELERQLEAARNEGRKLKSKACEIIPLEGDVPLDRTERSPTMAELNALLDTTLKTRDDEISRLRREVARLRSQRVIDFDVEHSPNLSFYVCGAPLGCAYDDDASSDTTE